MFQCIKYEDKREVFGFKIHSFNTSDKVLRYGENNQLEYSKQPTVVKHGSVRTINIYAAVPDVAEDKPIALRLYLTVF